MSQHYPIARFEAIGTHWWIGSYEHLSGKMAQRLAAELKAKAQSFDAAYSRFKKDSLISRLNQEGYLSNPPPVLIDMLEYAEQIRVLSAGVFNVAVGGQLDDLGYDAEYSFRETGRTQAIDQSAVTTLSDKTIQLRPGASIDLGGLGKGWLIDAMAAFLRQAGVTGFYVNGGGDIAVWSPGSPQTLAIENPFDPAQAIGQIALERGAVACSAPHKRNWQSPKTGRQYHHLIHPLTGQPHVGPAAIHTYAGTALAADAASTILYLTPEAGRLPMSQKLKVEYLAVAANATAAGSPNYPGRLFTP